MESPETGETTRITTRTSIIESFRGCGLAGMRIDKEELRRTLLMPQYLRLAMRDSIRLKDPAAGEARLIERDRDVDGEGRNVEPPQTPMVVFINRLSGGRHGPMLKERLQQLIAEEQVSIPSFSSSSLTRDIVHEMMV
jgi:diacylglycerol kinase (ATP)